MIIRVSKRERFVVIDKTCLEDLNLSFKAKGLLAYLLSKPDDWSVSSRGLVDVGPDQRSAIMAGLRELENAGYLTREGKRGANGQFTWESVVHEFSHGAITEPWAVENQPPPGAITRPRKTAPFKEEGTTEIGASAEKRTPNPDCDECGPNWVCHRHARYGNQEAQA